MSCIILYLLYVKVVNEYIMYVELHRVTSVLGCPEVSEVCKSEVHT